MSTIKAEYLTRLSTDESVGMVYVAKGTAKVVWRYRHRGGNSLDTGLNVSGITDAGTGRYTVNFTNAFENHGYAFLLSGGPCGPGGPGGPGGHDAAAGVATSSLTPGSLGVYVTTGAANRTIDADRNCGACLGGWHDH